MDKFGWTKDQVPIAVGICSFCRHKHRNDPNCDAFPDGIPRDVLDGTIDHKRPVAGDHGIRFEEGGAE
jgi:hypothetical protein